MRVSGSQAPESILWLSCEKSHVFLNRTLAVTSSKSREMDFVDVTKICSEYTINGLKIMSSLANKPFRFIYTSGVLIERDQSKSLPFLADYLLMLVCSLLISPSCGKIRLTCMYRVASKMQSWTSVSSMPPASRSPSPSPAPLTMPW
jgi:hypothetical protein